MNPSGQIAIVTGGGSGLGEATARALAAKGAKVAVFDVGMERAEKVAAEIGGIAVRCDVSSAESGEAAHAEAADRLGTARILINCAGIGIAMKTTGKDGAHPLDGGERGIIINTASVAAYDGQIGQAAYSSSKGGVVGMTLPVARDLSRAGIRVCTIAPGIFRTPMMAGLPEEAQQSLGLQVPFPPRLGEPPEYAALACHIVENQMLNGETIRLDGAIRMAPK